MRRIVLRERKVRDMFIFVIVTKNVKENVGLKLKRGEVDGRKGKPQRIYAKRD